MLSRNQRALITFQKYTVTHKKKKRGPDKITFIYQRVGVYFLYYTILISVIFEVPLNLIRLFKRPLRGRR